MSSLEPLSPEEIEALAQEIRRAEPIFTVGSSYPSDARWILDRFVRREEHERECEKLRAERNEWQRHFRRAQNEGTDLILQRDRLRADSELLAKVEGYIRRHEYLPDCTYVRESGGFYLAGLERGYPTLVEALRKLVGEEGR